MAVKLLINGFFRSGTTVVWRILRESNPSLKVYYEPCHQDLFFHIENYRKEKTASKLHNANLWDEYLSDDLMLDKLRKRHPGLNKPFPGNRLQLIDYVSCFHDQKCDSILQSNRWHMFVEDIGQACGCPVIHMLREPRAVFQSIRKSQLETAASSLQRALRLLVPGRAFGIRTMFDEISKRFGKRTRTQPFNMLRSPLDMFLVVWILTNYVAVKTARVDAKHVWYDKLLEEPEELAAWLRAKGIHFNHAGVLRMSSRDRFEAEWMLEEARRLDLFEEALEIVSTR